MRRSRLSPEAESAIRRSVAARALRESVAAWRSARKDPTVERVRGAHRACVFAARALRRAADVLPREADAMREEAAKVEATATILRNQLVRMGRSPTAQG